MGASFKASLALLLGVGAFGPFERGGIKVYDTGRALFFGKAAIALLEAFLISY